MDVERIHFEVDGDVVVGNLHLPTGSPPFPAVLTAGPMTSVKEQVTGSYAQAMAERGYAALAIDHRHYGESGGRPRQFEYYRHKIEDIQLAFDVLTKHPKVSGNQIFAQGVCLGCGYLAHAIGQRADVRAFSAVAGYYRDVPALQSSDPDGFAKKVAQGKSARETYESNGEVVSIPAVALDRDAAMTLQSTYDYYARRAVHPNYTNSFAVMSREYFLQFDVQSAAAELSVPFLMIHGENALSPA